MTEVRLSTLARADLEDIREYGLTHFGEAATARHRAALQDAFEQGVLILRIIHQARDVRPAVDGDA